MFVSLTECQVTFVGSAVCRHTFSLRARASDVRHLHLSPIQWRSALFVHTEGCIINTMLHVSEQPLSSFPDSLVPAQCLPRRTPAPPHPRLPPRRSRRSFYLKIPSCLCTPAAQWAVRTSSSLLQDKVTHTHTHAPAVSSLTLVCTHSLVTYSVNTINTEFCRHHFTSEPPCLRGKNADR